MPSGGVNLARPVLQFADSRKQTCGRVAGIHDGPPHKIGSPPEDHQDFAVPCRGLLLSAIDHPAGGAARKQRGRFGPHPLRSCGAKTPCLGLAPGIAREASELRTRSQDRNTETNGIDRNLHGPKGAFHSSEVGLIGDALVAQKLCPGTRWRIGQILNRAFAIRVPPRSRLPHRFPQEREAAVAMAKQDQAAPAPESAAASSRTLRGLSASGFQSPFRIATGDLPESCVRGRSNQRRIPNSL